MPIYVYRCPFCSKESEVIQKVDEPPPVCGDCEVVGAPSEMVRVFDASGGIFILKGSCWERDGYKK